MYIGQIFVRLWQDFLSSTTHLTTPPFPPTLNFSQLSESAFGPALPHAPSAAPDLRSAFFSPVGLVLSTTGCGPATQSSTIRTPTTEPATPGSTGAVSAGSNAFLDPFASNERITRIAKEIMSQEGDPVENMFHRLKVGGPEGLKYVDTHDYGLTAAETLEKGGDCSDFSNLAIAVIKEMNRLGANIKGGAHQIKFHNSPDVFHIIPFVEREGKRVIVDLQGAHLGETESNRYDLILVYPTFDQAAAIYYQEWADHYVRKQDMSSALTYYTRASEIFGEDPTVQHNLNSLHFNDSLLKAQKAFDEKRWDDCAALFEETVSWLKKIAPEKRKNKIEDISKNIEACRKNKAITAQEKVWKQLKQAILDGEKAFSEKRWGDCARHYQEALKWNQALPQSAERDQRSQDIQFNVEQCQRAQ